jgi:nucleotide-binding universal stress UspA family protein
MHVKAATGVFLDCTFDTQPGASMKTILALAGGSDTDKAVFSTALAVAKPLHANLECLHVWIDPAEAAAYTPHVAFARGPSLQAALGDLESEGRKRASAALHHFEELCESEAVEIAIKPADVPHACVSASWCEKHHDDAAGRIVRYARHNDLIVIGRRSRSNGLPSDLVEQVLIESGRPVLIASPRAQQSLIGTVLVCWKETPESARAIAATLPLLAAANRVVVASIEEGTGGSPENLYHLVQRLEWDNIIAEPLWFRSSSTPVPDRLEGLATEIDADLIIMGGYGHGRFREMVFGGCTQHFLDQSDRPVLLMH